MLGFYQHSRQRYGDRVAVDPRNDAITDAIQVGDFEDGDAGTIGPGGEFRIEEYQLTGRSTLRVCAFSDAMGSLKQFMSRGGAKLVEDGEGSATLLAQRLAEAGYADLSDDSLRHERDVTVTIRSARPVRTPEVLTALADGLDGAEVEIKEAR